MSNLATVIESAMQDMANGNLKDATKKFTGMLATDPRNPDLLHNTALVFQKQGMNGVAIGLIERAIDLGLTDLPQVYMNLANCYCQETIHDKADHFYRKALSTPGATRWQILSNMAALYVNQDNAKEALRCCNEALAENPEDDLSKFNRSIALLELGRWEEGFHDYHYAGLRRKDRKVRNYDLPPRADFPGRLCPFWNGEPNQTVIVYGEQGIGDEIMFDSIIPDLIEVSKQVIIECDHRLGDICKRSFPKAIVYPTTDEQWIEWPHDHEIDAKIPIGSLGYFFRKTEEEFPLTRSFLIPDPEKVQKWRARFDQISNRPKVCLSWIGGFKRTRMELRSIPLQAWLPILAQPCDFISLQYNDANGREGLTFGLHVFEEVLQDDIDEMCAMIAAADLTISVNNSQVHMAGSIGAPCWVLTPKRCAWRYHPHLRGTAQEERMLFYPSCLQYRQKKDEDWASVIGRVADDLQALNRQEAAE